LSDGLAREPRESLDMPPTSTRLLLGIGLAGLIMECSAIQPASAAD